MAVYNPASLKADEFINNEEILATLAYADEHKNDVELIDQILEKARPRKTATGCVCAGLTHREASVLFVLLSLTTLPLKKAHSNKKEGRSPHLLLSAILFRLSLSCASMLTSPR